MKLSISNFAKIKAADVQVKGITVICGLNNTGKSTVGKALHSIFNSLCGIDKEIAKQRRDAIEIEIAGLLRRYQRTSTSMRVMFSAGAIAHALSLALTRQLSDSDEKGEKNAPEWESGLISRYLNDVDETTNEELRQRIQRVYEETVQTPESAVKKSIISSYFGRMFGEQISPLHHPGTSSVVDLQIKQEHIKLEFAENRCRDYQVPFDIEHRSIYIDNPFVVDRLFSDGLYRPSPRMNETELVRLLRRYEDRKNDPDTAYKRLQAEAKLKPVFEKISSVLGGRITTNDSRLALSLEGSAEPVYLNNLSLGLKSFVILQMLLETLQLREKDVVVLDEPEIHLHAQWQVLYAEIIVMLQKIFDLSVVITTHSPFFLDAIELFSSYHGSAENTRFYLSENQGNEITIKDVTGSLNEVYDKITPSLALLKSLRYDLNNPDPA